MSWKECNKCGSATLIDTGFCPNCGILYKQSDPKDKPTCRRNWKQALLRAAKCGYYGAVLRGLAANTANRGDIFALIEDFCDNADPWDGTDEGR